MQYTSHYRSPIGNILLAADEIGLTGLWFEGQKYFALYLDKEHIEKEIPVLEEAKKWLDIYFTGKNPEFTIPLHFTGTPILHSLWADNNLWCDRKAACSEKRKIPYVSTGSGRSGWS